MKKLLLLFWLLISSLTSANTERFPLHSHNDYLHHDYLTNALAQRYESIEVDIWSWRGDIRVSHWPWNFKGTLEELYLRPLEKLVTEKKIGENGLLLWIDIKDFRMKTIYQLATILRRYPMIGKEIQIVLTGNKRLKRKFIQYFPDIKVERDFGSPSGSPSDVKWLALNWKDVFKWKGSGEMSPSEKLRLRDIVESVHAKGQKIRFYNSPDSMTYWKIVREAQVDLIDTDKVTMLAEFFRGLPQFP